MSGQAALAFGRANPPPAPVVVIEFRGNARAINPPRRKAAAPEAFKNVSVASWVKFGFAVCFAKRDAAREAQ